MVISALDDIVNETLPDVFASETEYKRSKVKVCCVYCNVGESLGAVSKQKLPLPPSM